MLDRRESARDKVIHGGVDDEIGQRRMTRDSVVRNSSEAGAHIEFGNVVKFPKQQVPPGIARNGRSLLAKIIQWRDKFVGVAFGSEPPYELPFSDLEKRLRRSERKKRQLQRRINALLSRD
jgi:hypothetical protein